MEIIGSIETGGSIKVWKWIESKGSIEAINSIKCGGIVYANNSLFTDSYIRCGGSIETGMSYGISAGNSILCKSNIRDSR